MPPIPYDYICEHYDFGSLSDWDLIPRNIFIRTGNTYDPYRIVPDTLYITTSGETIRVTNEDTVTHRFQSTDNSAFGLLGSTGGFAALDTGLLDPGESVILTLPTGLPSPYWFNLRETALAGGESVDMQRAHILVQNMECIE